MPGLTAFGRVLFMLGLASSARAETEQNRQQIETLTAGVRRCRLPKAAAELADVVRIQGEDETYQGASVSRLGRFWLLSHWYAGPSVESARDRTQALIDLKRCRAFGLEVSSIGQQPIAGATEWSEGKAAQALKPLLFKHLRLTLGRARAPQHAVARLIKQRQLAGLSITPFSESPLDSPYAAATWDKAASFEWISGKPVAQSRVLWPVEPGRSVVVADTAVPKLWHALPEYELWRVRRGHYQAVAMYHPKRRRHAWLLATPIGGAFQGQVSFIGRRGQTAYLRVGAFELVALHPQTGSQRIGRFEDLIGPGRLVCTIGDEKTVVQLDPPFVLPDALD